MTAATRVRQRDRTAGRCVFLPVFYVDAFVVRVSGTKDDALTEKSALATHLRQTTAQASSPEKSSWASASEEDHQWRRR